jgi:hypothetical protein
VEVETADDPRRRDWAHFQGSVFFGYATDGL